MPNIDRRAVADTVLWWCSEMGSGTIKQLASVCDQLRVPAWQTIRTLSALAHLEVAFRHGRWSACEPVLTTVPDLPGRLLLCGARPSALMEELRIRAEASELDVIVDTEPIPQVAFGPATVFLKASAVDAGAFALAPGSAFSLRHTWRSPHSFRLQTSRRSLSQPPRTRDFRTVSSIRTHSRNAGI
jgi:hypothetical protein